MKIEYLCRLILGLNNNHPIFILNSNKPPTKTGTGYYHTTPGGKYVRYPNAYGYRTIYHASTLAGEVGENWKPKIPAGMELNLKNGSTWLIRKTDGMDLHFEPKELLRKDFCTWARKEMAKNYVNRLKSQKLEKEFKNKTKNTLVNFNDARRGGACVAGIVSWAKNRLNMEREQLIDAPWLTQIPAKLLLRLDPNNQLVKNSINQAFLRETTVSI